MRPPQRPGGFGPVHHRVLERDDCRCLRDRSGGLPSRNDAGRRSVAALSAGRRSLRSGDRRDGRLEDYQRRVLAFRAGQVAASREPDHQLRPSMGRAADARDRRPVDHSVRRIPERSGVPIGRDHPESMEHVAAARRVRVGRERQRPVVVRASTGVYFARQNMLSQVGTVTTNGVQQQTIALGTFATGFATMPVWPGVVSPTPLPPGQFPAGSGIRVFDKNYVNPRVYSFNAAYEQQLVADVVGYVDVTWNEGRHLTRFLNYNRSGPSCCDLGPNTGDHFVVQRGAVGTAARRSHGDQQPRQLALPRPHARSAEAAVEGIPGRGQLCPREGRGRRLERAGSVQRRELQLLRPDEGLGSRRPATSDTSSMRSAISRCHTPCS